jgi:hypothetical protein
MATSFPTVSFGTIALIGALWLGCEQGPPVAARDTREPPGSTSAAANSTAAATSSAAASGAGSGALLTDAEDVALGAARSCVLKKGGAVSCFGDDLLARPTGVSDARQLASVDAFVCIVSAKGKLACVDAATGKRAELPVYRDGVVMVGGTHGFAVRTEDGVLRGGYIDPADPQPKPPSGMPGLKDPTAFALGTTLGCGVLDRTVWCWNTEKGHGMPATMAPVPEARGVAVGRERICVDTAEGEVWCYPADRKAKPAKLPGWSGTTALSIAYGDGARDRLCALGKDGAVRCASLEGEGPSASFAAPTAVPGLSPAARLASGASTRSCAITRAGEVWCWGPAAAPPTPVRQAP